MTDEEYSLTADLTKIRCAIRILTDVMQYPEVMKACLLMLQEMAQAIYDRQTKDRE